MRNFKSYQLTIVVTGVILLTLMLSRYRSETSPLELKPGFSAWVSLEGKLRIRYYNASAKSVLLNAYPPGYHLSDMDHNLLETDQAMKPSARDWVRIPADGAYDFYRPAGSYEPLNPHETYGIAVYTPTDSPPGSMFVEPSTALYPSERITTNEK